jgi:hypothetical protein
MDKDTWTEMEDRSLFYICEQLEPDVHRLYANLARLRRTLRDLDDNDVIDLAILAHRRGSNPRERAQHLVTMLREKYGRESV